MSRSHPASLLDAPGGALSTRLHAAATLAARHRRLGAAVCAGAAVFAAVSALSPTPAVPAPGSAGAVPRAPVPLPAGAGAGAVAGAERVAVTVRLADAAGTLLLRPGTHVQVIGGAPAGSAVAAGGPADAVVLAADAVVLVVPQPGGDATGDVSLLGGDAGGPGSSPGWAGSAAGDPGLTGVAVLSVAPADARALAAAAGTRPLSVTVALPAP